MEKSRYQSNIILGCKPGGIIIDPCGLLVLLFVCCLLLFMLGKVLLINIHAVLNSNADTDTRRLMLHLAQILHYRFNPRFHGSNSLSLTIIDDKL